MIRPRIAAALAALALLASAHPAAAAVPTVAAAKAWALHRLGAVQYACLSAIVERESHWNPLSGTVTGSYGIGQATPGTVMAGYGRAWRTDPLLQTHWTVDYVARRYGSACNAWSWWQSHRSY